jgi:hypothetical protein
MNRLSLSGSLSGSENYIEFDTDSDSDTDTDTDYSVNFVN